MNEDYKYVINKLSIDEFNDKYGHPRPIHMTYYLHLIEKNDSLTWQILKNS